MEVDYNLKAEPISVDDPDYGLSSEEFKSTYSGIENEIVFADNMRLNIEDNALVISLIERATDYKKENFEIEFFEVEMKEVKSKQGNAEVEALKRIYTTKNVRGLSSRDYIEEFFEVLVDREVADEFGVDFFGVNPEKLKNQIKQGIEESRADRPIILGIPQITPDTSGECE